MDGMITTREPAFAGSFARDPNSPIWLPSDEVAESPGTETEPQRRVVPADPVPTEIPEQRDPAGPAGNAPEDATGLAEDKPHGQPLLVWLRRRLRKVQASRRDHRRSRTPLRQPRHRASVVADHDPPETLRRRPDHADAAIEPLRPTVQGCEHRPLPTPSRRPAAVAMKPKSYLIKRAGVQVAYLASIGMSGYGQTMFFAGWMRIPVELTSMWKAAIGAVFLELVMVGSDGYSMYLRQQTPLRGWQTLRLIGWGACMVGAALQVAHFHGQVGVMFALATIFGFVLQDVSGHRKVVAYLEATGQLTPPPQIGLRRWLLYRGDAYTVWKRLVADPALDIDAEFRGILTLREARQADRKAAVKRREELRVAEEQRKTAEAQLATVRAQTPPVTLAPEQPEKQPAQGKHQAPAETTDRDTSSKQNGVKRHSPPELAALVPLALAAEQQAGTRLGYRKVKTEFSLSDPAARQLRELMDQEIRPKNADSFVS